VTVDTGLTAYITGEFGAALALAAIAVGYIFWRLRPPETLFRASAAAGSQ
jgi:hypothetical protein